MKIKHYRAADMRQALRQVRLEQGEDAVILSSRRTGDGVEVVAAVDYEVTQSRESQLLSTATPPPAPAGESCAAAAPEADDSDDWFEQPTPESDLSDELRSMRRLLETQLATLAWNDLTRRSPVQVQVLRELTQLGLAQDLAMQLAARLPAGLESSQAQRTALAMLARQLPVCDERWMHHGGVMALVGASGVGKTTVLAKLAARWVLQHGVNELALVSTDTARIGAHEQIQTLGRLLAVPVYTCESPQELQTVLRQIASRRAVLIDTAGLAPSDEALERDLTALASAAPGIELALVLSGAAQAGVIEQTLMRCKPLRPACCVLTKLDEAVSLGGVISALVRSQLPLAYVSEGRRVPEDLAIARAHRVIARAVELSRRSGSHADEDLLCRRFGAQAHALA